MVKRKRRGFARGANIRQSSSSGDRISLSRDANSVSKEKLETAINIIERFGKLFATEPLTPT
jgi:hypothetical protein